MGKQGKKSEDPTDERLPITEQKWFVTFYTSEWEEHLIASGTTGQAWLTYGFATEEERQRMLNDRTMMPVGTPYFLSNHEVLWVIGQYGERWEVQR